MKKIFVLLLCISMFSCKNETEESKSTISTTENTPVESVDKTLVRVAFNIVAEKDDKACLFYTEDGTINFDDKKTVWADIKGSTQAQEVVFNLPKEVLPTHIRIDLGRGKNPEQLYYDIKGFKVTYLDKEFSAQGNDVFNYFYPNKDINIITPKSTMLKKVSKDQETGVILYPHQPLSDELSKIVK
ncbi:hypothetical protein [Flavobacterium lacisediminis]|uniref:F5/8 type C domain-containing protein n=1 Tax=Flavobacterium lacisediminis TaxID=2989705 RepID=A0ABT3EEA5_9FLAO|nr:hypothetical protein [Flavobacterium lacisediminis]MCW1146903.1 hypothetical protein [Flavobacterium lacisediminis]